ncbi:hypothetical protein M0534_13200 [Methylonatrum kenyense]|uniref:hypothetical protein n=1 Tax=Methylonatrum kenyense TaxID=455253 RepID=UPI0020BF2957|nr:hypothetical protein [Methylonatrum kenyense]MCK8517271.1 hypothetical protein [Methylonatrum kenyense]
MTKLEYDSGSLRVENKRGLCWQVDKAPKPDFSFAFDAVSVNDEHALRRVGTSVHALADTELEEVKSFVERLQPPAKTTLQKQVVMDLRAFAHGLINSVVTPLEYDGLLDVMITGRQDSTDLYAEEARRVLTYVDAVWNAYHGLAAQILNTPEAQLRSAREYAEQMPFPPELEHFSNVVPENLFHGPRNPD